MKGGGNMFTKILLALCNVLFDFYGWLYRYGVRKNMDDVCKYCVEQREELLDSMFTLKGLK
jgi:hypothetical protein